MELFKQSIVTLGYIFSVHLEYLKKSLEIFVLLLIRNIYPAKIIYGLFMAALLLPLESICQSRINGEIRDNLGKPIAYANVLLMSPIDSLIIKGSVSEENGSFYFDQLDKTEYLLSVSLIGYKMYRHHLKIDDNTFLNLPTIFLLDSEEELEEIQVTAQMPLYEKKIDRMVINVQASITAAGNSVLEVLQNSPGVIVNRQSSSILLNGKSGVTIMINNRIQRLPMDVIFQMMDGMSAANIEKIELITNPPAKYDAEGMGGVIHLIIAQSTNLGTKGNFGLVVGMNARETLGTHFNLNHRKEKFSFFANYSIMYNHNIEVWENHFQIHNPDFVSSFRSTMTRQIQLVNQSFRTGIEVELSSKTKLGALVSAVQRNWEMNANTEFIDSISPDSSRYGHMNLYELDVWNHFTSNIHLTHNFNTQSTLRLDLDYNRSVHNNPSSYLLDFHYPELNRSSAEMIDITKSTPIDMLVAGMDYSFKPSATVTFEAGIKGTFSKFENEVEVLHTREGLTFRDDELSVMAFLKEDLLAGYMSAEWVINESNQINAGIRFENTHTKISTAVEKGIVNRNFGNFFPSIFYKKTISDKLNFDLVYSRRIQRPTFSNLAPYVIFIDPNTFLSGNTSLLPAIIESIKTDINFRRANLSFEYSHTNNQIAAYMPEIDPINNRQIRRSHNLDYQRIFSINLHLPWIINDWCDIQLNSGGFYNMLRTAHLEENIGIDFFNFTANLTSNFILPRNFSAEITGVYTSNDNWGIWQYDPMGSLNIGIQKKLSGDQGNLRLNINDILYTSVFKGNTFVPELNFTNYVMYDFHRQLFRLVYTRNFGNKKLRGVHIKSGSEELQKRVQ